MAGRPREFDRDQALHKALVTFWQYGYEGTSMALLVSALGIASARIYAAFGSKEQLFREVVALYLAEQGGFAERVIQRSLPVSEAVAQILADAIATYTRADGPRGCLAVSSTASGGPDITGVLDWMSELRRQRTQSIIDLLQQAHGRGELKADADPEALGDLFATLLHGIAIQARDGIAAPRLQAMIKPALSALHGACA
ncbi:TetR/AcrR family transcriptional regulator [Pseudomonas tructae]|uniref:TetR/AcrR family transcriptional regulator n=1 Tax=Pseudomonas tructae TaxID=2518644 RepID=A0A411MJX3_9PSED|nr:TetR/AcrR family transcriptional regulator [Pseudomonas tructae]QBF27078.1 TetR/AcrR family transcriptional regulator [Pseudomonas tructae]